MALGACPPFEPDRCRAPATRCGSRRTCQFPRVLDLVEVQGHGARIGVDENQPVDLRPAVPVTSVRHGQSATRPDIPRIRGSKIHWLRHRGMQRAAGAPVLLATSASAALDACAGVIDDFASGAEPGGTHWPPTGRRQTPVRSTDLAPNTGTPSTFCPNLTTVPLAAEG